MKRTAILSVASLLVIACGSDEPIDAADPTTATGGGAATATTTSTGGTGSGAGGAMPGPTLRTVTGDVTWTVTFDAAAKANGHTDCAYTRHYEGVEDASAPWLCPACEVMFRTDVAIVSGLDDCYAQVSETAPSAIEWLGYADGVYYRGFGGPMGAQGTATVTPTSIEAANNVPSIDVPAGGTLAFDVAGTLAVAEQAGDPLHGFNVPDSYACGWPKADPPPYTGDYTISVGATVPDGTFKDECDQTVRLHDFAGEYLIIDMSAIDCPPCQQMASEEEAFIQSMAAQGITVHVITLLAPSLADPLGETTTLMIDNWKSNFGLTAPVLADRGWGLSMFYPLFTDQTGYPSWVVVDPNLQVIDLGNGFGGYADHEQTIVTDAGM